MSEESLRWHDVLPSKPGIYAVRWKAPVSTGGFRHTYSTEFAWDATKPWPYDPDIWEWAGPLGPTQTIAPLDAIGGTV